MIFRFIASTFGLAARDASGGAPAGQRREGRGVAKIRRIRTTDRLGRANEVRERIATLVAWVLASVLMVSLVSLILYGLLGRNTPGIVENSFWATLGYFGGAFVSFMNGGTDRDAKDSASGLLGSELADDTRVEVD